MQKMQKMKKREKGGVDPYPTLTQNSENHVFLHFSKNAKNVISGPNHSWKVPGRVIHLIMGDQKSKVTLKLNPRRQTRKWHFGG